MKLIVLKHIRLRKAGKLFDIKPGAIITIPRPEKAQALIQSGHVRPILPPDEAGKVQAVRIYSKILEDEVWVCNSPSAVSLVPMGAVVYLQDEIRNLKGATPEDVQAVHRVKKEFPGACLIEAKERGEG